MIEELQILKGIVGELTGLGIWFVVLFFAYKLAWVGVCSGAVVALYKFLVRAFCCDVTKKEYEEMISKHKREIESKEESIIHYKKEVAKVIAESERVLHMYEILKEANK